MEILHRERTEESNDHMKAWEGCKQALDKHQTAKKNLQIQLTELQEDYQTQRELYDSLEVEVGYLVAEREYERGSRRKTL